MTAPLMIAGHIQQITDIVSTIFSAPSKNWHFVLPLLCLQRSDMSRPTEVFEPQTMQCPAKLLLWTGRTRCSTGGFYLVPWEEKVQTLCPQGDFFLARSPDLHNWSIHVLFHWKSVETLLFSVQHIASDSFQQSEQRLGIGQALFRLRI